MNAFENCNVLSVYSTSVITEEENKIKLNIFKQRIELELKKDRPIQIHFLNNSTNSNNDLRRIENNSYPVILSNFEKNENTIKKILSNNNYNIDNALSLYLKWIDYRISVNADNITNDDIKAEINYNLAPWKGKDKNNRPCCIITGRNLPISNIRLGNYKTFNQFLIRTVEDGCKLADENNSEELCIIYDRRCLEYSNIDPILNRMCKSTIDELKNFYRYRLGKIYIVHINWFYWAIFYLFLKPLFGLFDLQNKIHIVSNRDELLEYFNEEDLFLDNNIDNNNNNLTNENNLIDNDEN
jgi:hypothetical protein